jgi:hypothetical protein
MKPPCFCRSHALRSLFAIALLAVSISRPVHGAVVTYEITGFSYAANPLPSRLVFSYETNQVGIICINTDGEFGTGVGIIGSAYYGGELLADFHSINLVVFSGYIQTMVDCEIPSSPAHPGLGLGGLTAFRPDGRLLGDGEVYTTQADHADSWGLNGLANPPVQPVPGQVYGWGQLTMREIPEPGTGAFSIGACVWLLFRRTRARRETQFGEQSP